MKIEFDIKQVGFLKEHEYLQCIPVILKKFDNDFPDTESVKVVFEEKFERNPIVFHLNEIEMSEDKKNVLIKYFGEVRPLEVGGDRKESSNDFSLSLTKLMREAVEKFQNLE
jgi:hypothetical protein